MSAYKTAAAFREALKARLRALAKDGPWEPVGPRRAVADGAAGLRLPVIAYVGATQWSRFHVDLVGSDLRMTGEPEDVPALALVGMADIKQGGTSSR